MQARKTTHGLDGQHRYVEYVDKQDSPLEESIRMTEDRLRDKWRKYVG